MITYPYTYANIVYDLRCHKIAKIKIPNFRLWTKIHKKGKEDTKVQNIPNIPDKGQQDTQMNQAENTKDSRSKLDKKTLYSDHMQRIM